MPRNARIIFRTGMMGVALSAILTGSMVADSAVAPPDGTELAALFEQHVDRRLVPPASEQQMYAGLLQQALTGKEIGVAQYVLVVDRSEHVQAAMIYWMAADGAAHFIGASPVSTGKPGRFEYFQTPLGVFAHTTENPDFRAKGTRNENGIRGYGGAGMRVFDFGWQKQVRGWGRGGEGVMRLQVHATDPDILEPRVGSTQSKGCIRIPESLNRFLDHYGILDRDYEEGMKTGKRYWVLRRDREPTAWSGQYLVVVDSARPERPAWAVVTKR